MKKIIYILLTGVLITACSNDPTGSDNPTKPTAIFATPLTTIEAGTTITFDNSSLDATGYSWIFNGGDPQNSTAEKPSVTYHTPGTFSVSLTAVNSAGDNTLTRANYITVVAAAGETMATYNVTFIGNWSAVTHPADFPAGDHFSMVAGMAHKAGTTIFEENEIATPGIELMAESGNNSDLKAEVEALVASGSALSYLEGPGLVTGFSEVTFEISVTDEFPLVTLVSMIAPSPDWFIAVEDVELFKEGAFTDNLTINALAYDAGTDNGTTYSSADEDTDPAAAITRISGPPLGNGTAVDPPAAMFTFVRTD